MPRKNPAPPEPAPIAYSYLRFSHPDQAKGDSLRRQEALRDAWLTRNGVLLDTSLTLEDKGVSAFTGEHRKNPDRNALALFLEMIRRGRVARGSYLVIENLDRLSREHEVPACHLLTGILMEGVQVVQLSPYEMVLTEKSNGWELMRAVMELSRGHGESKLKSDRVGGAWAEKKRRGREGEEQRPTDTMGVGSKVLTRRVPAWLRVEKGRFVIDPEKAAIIQRIFRWAIEGYGIGAITRKLNVENVPVISIWKRRKPSEYWSKSSVGKILHNHAVFGEYQPHTRRGGKRRPDGPPIPDYFPAIVTPEEWHAAQAAMQSRKQKGGRPPVSRLNLFTGLLKDARDGGGIHVIDKGKRSGYRPLLVPHRAANGAQGATMVSFPLEAFEAGIRKLLREINPTEVLPGGNGAAERVLSLIGERDKIEARMKRIQAQLVDDEDDDDLDPLVDVLRSLSARHQDKVDKLAEAQRAAASPLSSAWGEFKTIDDALASLPPEEQEAGRLRLRAALRRIVERMWCLFLVQGATRLAVVQLWFTGGAQRTFAIRYQAAFAGFGGPRPASYAADSLAALAGPRVWDLRKRAEAKALEKLLLKALEDGKAGK